VKAAVDGAPEAFLDGQRLPVRLSITHRAGLAACLVAPEDILAGCDMELVEPRDDGFVADYFTASERTVVAAAAPEDRPLMTTLIWSAKESALKAVRVGLRADTRDVDVRLLPWINKSGWAAFAVYRPDRPRLLSGWWRAEGANIITLVCSPPADPPLSLL
jgi:4'-phosphopantetheinyl transferase